MSESLDNPIDTVNEGLTLEDEAGLLTDTSSTNGESDQPDPDQEPGDLDGADIEEDDQ